MNLEQPRRLVRLLAAARFARGLGVLLARDEDVVLLVGHALMLRYTLDAAGGLVPAARMAPVEHAHPYELEHADVERAAELLAELTARLVDRYLDVKEQGLL